MVYITSELWYEGEKVGYRCYINDKKSRSIKYVDIDTEEYQYINAKYGNLVYCTANQIGKARIEQLKINPQGYLYTGTEPHSYSNEGLKAVESNILDLISSDLECIKKNRSLCYELKRRYKEFNSKYFYNKLPQSMRIVVNPRFKTVAGQFTFYRKEPYRNNISLATKYIEMYPEEVDDTLIHEMIHAYLYELGYWKEGHGARFKQEMRRLNNLGCNITIYNENSFSTKKYNYALQCMGCGLLSKGVRKLKYDLHYYRCSICNSNFELVHKDTFYKAYKCNNCDEIFFEDDQSAIDTQQYCPCCGFELSEI